MGECLLMRYEKKPTPPLPEQRINYTMLYDHGDECTDITGGWELKTFYSGSATVTATKNEDSFTISTSSGNQGNISIVTKKGFATKNAFPVTNGQILVSFGSSQAVTQAMYGSNSSILTIAATSLDGNTATNYMLNNNVATEVRWQSQLAYSGSTQDNITGFTRRRAYMIINSTVDAYVATYGMKSYYGYVKSNIDAICIANNDDWETLASIAGIEATSITDLIAKSTSLLTNEDAVNFMIYNCTGDFMMIAVGDDTFTTALNSSPYKTVVLANEHWAKFLAMVA